VYKRQLYKWFPIGWKYTPDNGDSDSQIRVEIRLQLSPNFRKNGGIQVHIRLKTQHHTVGFTLDLLVGLENLKIVRSGKQTVSPGFSFLEVVSETAFPGERLKNQDSGNNKKGNFD
jgi:hypothetical protein